MLGVTYVTANTPDCGPLGFMLGSGTLNNNVAGQLIATSCLSSPEVYQQQEKIANAATLALPLILLLLLPGWYKLFAVPVGLIGIPGINFKDGTPVFRPAFYGGF